MLETRRRGSGSVTCSCARPGGTPLLTAAQEVELAKRIDRADMESKQRMVESNLRLVVSMRKLGLTRRGCTRGRVRRGSFCARRLAPLVGARHGAFVRLDRVARGSVSGAAYGRVVIDEDPKHMLEMAPVQDQEPAGRCGGVGGRRWYA
jgi:hypothetical protein